MAQARISFNYKGKSYYINIDFNDIVKDANNHDYTAVKCYTDTDSKTYYLAIITWYNHAIDMFPYKYEVIDDNILEFEPINKKPIYHFTIEF